MCKFTKLKYLELSTILLGFLDKNVIGTEGVKYLIKADFPNLSSLFLGKHPLQIKWIVS